MSKRALHVHANADTLNQAVADQIATLSAQAISRHGSFFVALSGGSTPRRLYQLLSSPAYTDHIDWPQVHIFFGDERCVPHDHPDSNFRMADEALLAHVPIPAQQIHAIPTDASAAGDNAASYERVLRDCLPHDNSGGWPQFDLVLLGLGPDGHTASLFPDTAILRERQRAAAAVYVDKLDAWRISLTLPTLEQARQLLFMVTGSDKAEIVRHALQPLPDDAILPVQRLQPGGSVDWHIDRAAAAALADQATS